MRLTYSPEDGESRSWVFDPKRVRQAQAEVIERRYGENWDRFVYDVQSGSAKARRVLLWHLLSREQHTLRYEDTPDFYMGEVEVIHSVNELNDLRDRILKMNLSPEEREKALTALDLEITDRIEEEEPAEGKANSPTNATGTG